MHRAPICVFMCPNQPVHVDTDAGEGRGMTRILVQAPERKRASSGQSWAPGIRQLEVSGNVDVNEAMDS